MNRYLEMNSPADNFHPVKPGSCGAVLGDRRYPQVARQSDVEQLTVEFLEPLDGQNSKCVSDRGSLLAHCKLFLYECRRMRNGC